MCVTVCVCVQMQTTLSCLFFFVFHLSRERGKWRKLHGVLFVFLNFFFLRRSAVLLTACFRFHYSTHFPHSSLFPI